MEKPSGLDPDGFFHVGTFATGSASYQFLGGNPIGALIVP
jgi:hypothetical protein